MNIIPNTTLMMLQLVPFLVTLVATWFIIFKPMLAYLDARENSTIGARKKAEEINKEAAQRTQELEEQLRLARIKTSEIRSAARAEALEEYNNMITKARLESEQHVAEAVKELEREKDIARITLRSTAKEIGHQIASQSLGRELA